jgi:hypothetical protein
LLNWKEDFGGAKIQIAFDFKRYFENAIELFVFEVP